jgi:hypothetical protein
MSWASYLEDIQEFREELINFRALLERPPEQQSRN